MGTVVNGEQRELFSKRCENPPIGDPEQICKELSGFAQGDSFHGSRGIGCHVEEACLEADVEKV